VLVTTDTIGGVWPYSLELADALAPHGVEVTLATMGDPLRPGQRLELGRSAVAEVHEERFALEWMEEPWADVDRAAAWLLDLAGDVRPDVVHLNGFAHAALEWGAPVLVVGHSCVLSWFRAVRGEEAPPAWGRYALAVGRGLQAADALVAPTRAMLVELERLYHPTCPRHVIPNARRPLAAPGRKEPFVLAGGRLDDEAKNVAAVDRVAASLGWPVLLAGDPSPKWTARNARLLGRLDSAALGSVLARASIYVAPARYEPFGLGALEAALAGCALVLGDIASLREVWDEAALYVDPADDEALATALRLLIDHPALLRELAEAAGERARMYGPERMARGYLDVYEQLRGPNLSGGLVAPAA
jgi:glycosyltransferase involved in cell wall biosynthesis